MTKKIGSTKWVFLLALIVIVLVIVCFFFYRWFVWDQSEYQAVFLSNNQVYFGKVDKLHSSYIELSDIYYLQLRKALQDQAPPQSAEQSAQSRLTLIKLGNELHGPKDKMLINSDQILFVENLKEDSRVVGAIREYQAAQ